MVLSFLKSFGHGLFYIQSPYYQSLISHFKYITPLLVKVDVGCEKWTWNKFMILMFYTSQLPWNEV
jgi:hypothetical protein